MSSRETPLFGALLRGFRSAAALTQEQLAARAGLSPDAIAALESGKRRSPRAVTIELLADALGLEAADRQQFAAAARGVQHGQPGTAAPATPGERLRPSWQLLGQPTPLVDRTEELETILQRLRGDGVRLLTLTGPAGVGKTRLALTAATHLTNERPDRFTDGVVVIDLTPVRDPLRVLPTIAQALGLVDTGRPPLAERLRAFLQERETLLVLDNFEQVLPAAAALAELLASCPRLTLLVTSRVPLHARAEQTLRIPPLPVPDLTTALPPPEVLFSIPSVALFVGRAHAQRADFAFGEQQAPFVAQLVAQLDGLPLALELAAARLDILPLPALARRLGDRLQLLESHAPDAPERQRSLEAAVGWSYDLLSEGEQRLFRCLGVFVGRVALDAIATVESAIEAGGDEASERAVGGGRETGRTLRHLLSLAEKSLILPPRPEASGEQETSPSGPGELVDDETAFGMLETVREYAWERLAVAGELTAARRAHARYFLALAEQAAPLLRGPDQRAWFLRLEREHDNLRAALRWLLDQDDPAEEEAALRLAGALGDFWWRRGYHAEGRRWLEAAFARSPHKVDSAVRIRALLALGGILTIQGEVTQAQAMLGEGLALAERRQDEARIADTLTSLGLRAIYAGEVAEATSLLQDALRRWESLGDPWGQGVTRSYLGLVAVAVGDVSASVSHYTAALHWFDTTGDTHLGGIVRCYLGGTAWERGDVHRAVDHVQAGLRTSVALEDRLLLSIVTQTAVAFMKVDFASDPQARLLGAADALVQATGATMLWDRSPEFQNMVRLREQLARGEGEGAPSYREGRTLSFGEVATSILRLLEEASQSLLQPEHPQPARQTTKSAEEADVPYASENPLTAREVEVLRLVAQGLSSKEIGRTLSLSPSTVNHHIQSVFNKLGVDTRAQAIAVATQRDFL